MIPSSALPQRRSISRVKCFASWGERITSSVSSLVWAAEGDQLKLPVITVLLSITANLSGLRSSSTAQFGFSAMLRCRKPEFKPLSLVGLGEMPHSYEELSELGLLAVGGFDALIKVFIVHDFTDLKNQEIRAEFRNPI